ncbi:DUF6968 family protein [Janthinobacterium violaceinigrum]|uniref:DUF6968 domain-containing protein n=1 Tax=Janthinobacterium violaceinigrum TaxID=2654252 RepID=A0A6I1I5K6_9BURK|nr:hypothetical protein [Janthinobacterium violaceinigrum]KAB8066253.1 hypothetical protein GCN75_03400 [Janthinobacterium violaceinigrum]
MKTTDPKFIVEDSLVRVAPDGSESTITARVGTPFLFENSWYCAAELEGIDGRYQDRSGLNATQALSLALSLIQQRLTHLIEDGNVLYLPSDREINIDSTFLSAIFAR